MNNRYIRKNTTLDVWESVDAEEGLWVKVQRGVFTKPTSKPVGYATGPNFFPFSKPRKYHEVVKVDGLCGPEFWRP